MSETRQTEQTLLRHIRSRASHSSLGSLRLGIGDDCALLLPHRARNWPLQQIFPSPAATSVSTGTHPNPSAIGRWRAG